MTIQRGRRRVPCTALLLCTALAGLSVFPAAGELSNEQKARVQRIEDAVLAPCCYTEPVSTHQSEVALKMRMEIARWVEAGRSDQEILDTYVTRYGSKVLVDPRTIPGSWTPWVPWLAVIFAVMLGYWILRRWRATAVPATLPPAGADTAVLPDLDDED